MVARGPEEGPPLFDPQASQVYRASAPEIKMLAWKISPNDCNQVDLVIQRGRSRKVGRSAAKGLLHTRKWGLDRVERHRTNNQNGHSSILPFKNVLNRCRIAQVFDHIVQES